LSTVSRSVEHLLERPVFPVEQRPVDRVSPGPASCGAVAVLLSRGLPGAARLGAMLQFQGLAMRIGDVDPARSDARLFVVADEDPARDHLLEEIACHAPEARVLLIQREDVEADACVRYAQLDIRPLAEPVTQRALRAALDADSAIDPDPRAPALIGDSKAMIGLRTLVDRVARSDATVLVLGETGVGKEVVARNIHYASPRADGPFVAVNCGAIPQDLLESELFGHEKGAFTGAVSSRKGRFELARGGTIFLDEIGDMPMAMQVKLLRVLQERTFEPVGSGRSVEADVRVVAATHRDLESALAVGTFREDLYYRLSVFPVQVPALRERLEDLPTLISELVDRLERRGADGVTFDRDALEHLSGYEWPGNVRELANFVERESILHPNELVSAARLPQKFQGVARVETAAQAPSTELPEGGIDLRAHLTEIEARLIVQALERTRGTVAHAAQLLDVRRTTLIEKMRKYGIEPSDGDTRAHWTARVCPELDTH